MSSRTTSRTEAGAAALALVVMAVAAQPAMAQGPSPEPPPPLPMEELTFPAFEEHMLSNGADLVVVGQHEQPFVTVNLLLRSGSSSDPRNKIGAAGMTAGLLTKGTTQRTADEIAQAVDFIGATLSAGASTDWTSVTLAVLERDLDRGLEIMADVVMNPTFPEDELALLKQQALTGLQVQLSQAGAVADRAFTRTVFGRHPYGKLDTPETVENLDQRSLARFHRRYYKPTNALFVVAGDVERDDIVARLEAAFGAWEPGSVRPPTYFSAPEREEREIVLVHKPGSVQSEIRIGHVVETAGFNEWVPLEVATRVLGGGSSGRLFKVIREDKGWSYGAYAQAQSRKDVSLFRTQMSVRNEVTDSALAEALHQIEELRTVPVPTPELEAVKSDLVGSFPLGIETPQQIASQVASYRLLDRSQEDLEGYRELVAAVTPDDVLAAARAHLHPARAVIVVVGDATEIRQGLAELGPVRLEDVQGERLALEDIVVRESDIAWDPSSLTPGRYTYQVLINQSSGNQTNRSVGEMTRMITQGSVGGESAWRVSTSTSLPNQSINEEVAFTRRSFRPLEASINVNVQGRSFGTELTYRDGRIRGQRTAPDGTTREIDREVVAGVLLGEMQELAVWITDLAGQKELRFPVVNLGNGRVNQVKLEVRGTTEVTVPAGTFQAYEVDLSGGEQTQRAYFRVEAPHVLLKVEPQGAPIIIELTALPGGG